MANRGIIPQTVTAASETPRMADLLAEQKRLKAERDKAYKSSVTGQRRWTKE